ncbi:MAG: DUF6155 family protein [Caldilineaceae bacterium]
MPTEAKPPTWTTIKRALADLDQAALIELVRDLYQLNNDNKVFLSTRFTSVDVQTLAEPYRKAIREQFNPARGFPKLNLRSARKALNDFKKACSDPTAVADLLIYYVEQGVICTKNYGDIDENFYSSLESVYDEAITVIVKQNDAALAEQFYARMRRIVRDTSGMGWGFHDYLAEEFHSRYPQANE